MSKYAQAEESMEIFSNISLCTLDVILRCAFSYENDCQEKGYVIYARWCFCLFCHVLLMTACNEYFITLQFSWNNNVDILAFRQDHPYVKAVNELGDLWVKRTL